jgi:hypothetical protein
MRKIVLLLPAILLAFALPALPAEEEDDDETTRIRVEVKTQGGKPIDRASVIVRFVEGRSIAKLGKKIRTTWEMRTNQEGAARMPAIPQGKIMIQVIAKGYQTFGDTFEIDEPEKTVEIKLNRPQAQYSVHQ